MIDRRRGIQALQKFFTDVFEHVLITDFWTPRESVCAEDVTGGGSDAFF